jgi:predicted nucleotidyltransferase
MPRPRTGKALSAAERMRRYRARRRSAGMRSVSSWTPSHARDQVLAKANLIRTLARAYGATSIELFGSAARGSDTPGSDLDFMVELEPGRSLLDLIGLGADLEAALGRKVDAVSKAAMKPRVLARARKDAIRLV